jgi:hypothetical protein
MLTLYPLSFFLCIKGLSSALVCTFISQEGASLSCADGVYTNSRPICGACSCIRAYSITEDTQENLGLCVLIHRHTSRCALCSCEGNHE